MQKRFFVILIFIFSMFLNINNIFADKWTCAYYYTNEFDTKFEFHYEFNTKDGSLKIANPKEDSSYTFNTYSSFTYSDELKYLEKNTCPLLHLVKIHNSDSSGVDEYGNGHVDWYYYYVYTDSWMREERGDCVNQRDGSFDKTCLSQHFKDFLTISWTSIDYYSLKFDANNKINKNNKKVDGLCPSFLLQMRQIEEKYKSYENNKTPSSIAEANKIIDKMSENCKSILSYRDYEVLDSQGDSVKDICIKKCLNINTEINTVKKKYNIPTNFGIGEHCGFSEKLIIYIANIVKWIKYIVPVIVIVFGIIDFIQAIASNKDDEMKKAQGKFIKRLIAAALVFIIPIIIEFVLNVMGFEANGCGIIDL